VECLKSITERQGRCYELALHAILNEPGAHYFTLVHGRIFDAMHNRIIPHAWVEVADSCYDPVLNDYFPTSLFMTIAVAEARYDHGQAQEMFAKHQCWGPWHD
jgi:hypothetical protein